MNLFSRVEDFIYKKIIRKILLMSQLGRQSVLGDAATGYNFDYMYRNQAHGSYGVGKLVDHFLLRLPAVKATRARKNKIIKMIGKEIEKNESSNQTIKIMDIACGAARYLIELQSTFGRRNVEILALDYDHKSLQLGREIAESYGVSDDRLRFIKGNAFRISKLQEFGKKINWIPDILIASGLIEYLNDDDAQGAFREIYKGLSDGGVFIFANQQRNPSRKLMEKVCMTRDGAWVLNYREPDIVLDWLAKSGFVQIRYETDAWGMYNLFHAKKSGEINGNNQ